MPPLPNFKDQFAKLPPPPVVDLTGRTVVVTGANTGIGYEIALYLSTLNPAKLILACRSLEKGKAAVSKITEATQGKGCLPEVWSLDLGSLKSTKAFGERCLRELQRLDVFISNAGMMTMTKSYTGDGYETALQVNNISNTLLCTMVLPLLTETAELPAPVGSKSPGFKPHMDLVSSAVHFGVKSLPGDEGPHVLETMNAGDGAGIERYQETKAIVAMNVITLQNLAGDKVIVNCSNPGMTKSNFGSGNGVLASMVSGLAKSVLGRTTEMGARCIIWAALSDTPGAAYCDTMEARQPSEYVLSERGRKAGASIFEEMKGIWKLKVGWEM